MTKMAIYIVYICISLKMGGKIYVSKIKAKKYSGENWFWTLRRVFFPYLQPLNTYTSETRFSECGCQTPFVHYIKSIH